MVLDTLGTDDRLIGMIQPELATEEDTLTPPLFNTGCAGRISSFMEADDDRLLIALTGVCRFDVREEVSSDRGYRRVIADWSRWEKDMQEEGEPVVSRPQLESSLRQYFTQHNITVDWEAIEKMPLRPLITFLSMNLPFDPADKQLLLEAQDTIERAQLLITLTDMGAAGDMTQH